ncbi:Gfo/Idh/MocA family protein, partial [Candidatus Hydrogenedentota bacterium]
IKIGVIGCGEIAEAHIKRLAEVEGASVTAVSSRNRTNGEVKAALVRELGAGTGPGPLIYTDYEELIKDTNVDGVIICTPPCAHLEPTLFAAKHGKHVYCEGPIAGDLREADAMIEAAREAGIKFTIQYGTRFDKAAHTARHAINTGKLGKVFLAKTDVLWYRPQAYFEKDAWRGTWAGERGGVTMHHGRYTIDLYLWLMGEVSEVYAHMGTFTHDIEIEDCSTAVLKFKSGALGQITATTSAHSGIAPMNRIEIFGEKGSVCVLPEWALASKDKKYEKQLAEELEGKELGPDGGAQAQTQDWISAIREDREPFISAESTCAQVEVARAVYKSAATGMPVTLPLADDDPYGFAENPLDLTS